MEYWDVLDEEGNITGKVIKKGDKDVWKKGIYHPAVDIWIINSKGEILIQKRSPNKKFEPNVWAMTGGNVIKGETPKDAIVREVLEELGITLNEDKVTKIKRYKIGNVWLDVYITFVDIDLDKIVLKEDELTAIKFATIDEIEKLIENDLFIKNRWEYISEELKEYLGYTKKIK